LTSLCETLEDPKEIEELKKELDILDAYSWRLRFLQIRLNRFSL
jgi:hypothetical protein